MSSPRRVPPPPRDITWGLAAGLAGSLCCLGPAAAALLGLGTSSALAALQIGRAPASALALALLGAGGALALRRGATCDRRPVARTRALLLMLVVFGLSYGLLAHALPASAARGIEAATMAQPAPAPSGPATVAQRQLTLSIEKMYCPPCAARVRRLLAERPGVASFVASADSDEVVIIYQPAQVAAAELAQIVPPSYGITVLSDVALP